MIPKGLKFTVSLILLSLSKQVLIYLLLSLGRFGITSRNNILHGKAISKEDINVSTNQKLIKAISSGYS